MLEQLLPYFVFVPLLAFFLSLLFKNSQEKSISLIAICSVAFQFIALLAFTVYWFVQHAAELNLKYFVFYQEANIEIFVDFYFDKITAVFAILGAFITGLVVLFSKYYLHRDQGFKRFFNTILLFYFAYNLTIFSGNFETLFIGWEFLGITSFLLISFYRDRYLPVKNALKTISLYRLGDICLILSLWTCHHIWNQNITFMQLNDSAVVLQNIADHPKSVIFLLSMIVIASVIKSAQFPFSSWLPRAMEGPTTSSAVFYGSLAIHIGAFLLLRTYPYWQEVEIIKWTVISIGGLSAVIASLITRVQSTVKTQIAYASVTQIGLIFIEIALGWHVLALAHISGNALLRTYQLLVSPSILGYMIHDQVFNFKAKPIQPSSSKWKNSLYVLNSKEWNMDLYLKYLLWNPFKRVGKFFNFLSNPIGFWLSLILLVIGFLLFKWSGSLPDFVEEWLHIFFAFIGMVIVLLAFAERQSALKAWILIITSQFYIVLSIALLNDLYEYIEILLYVSGLSLAAIIGGVVLWQLRKRKAYHDLQDFYGQIHNFPKLATWFLIASLAFVGLPFTPTFIGLDLMYSHIDHEEYLLTTFITISFLVLELAVLRIYARLFLGPSKIQNHPIAYRSS